MPTTFTEFFCLQQVESKLFQSSAPVKVVFQAVDVRHWSTASLLKESVNTYQVLSDLSFLGQMD